MSTPLIGILSLQGGVAEHQRVLDSLKVAHRLVRKPADLDGLDGLIFPGGESTTMSHLLVTESMFDPVREALRAGLPAFGTCAGMILLADEVLDTRADAVSFGVLPVTVRRNAFGRQAQSFEADLDMVGFDEPVHAVFIRAPQVEIADDEVEVLARVPEGHGDHSGAVVAVRCGNILATSFHPECQPGETRLHEYFVTECVGGAVGTQA
ncbi:pyridoxal 5'-phosphate synthase glutaminase subunit PdxT [Corynebacterium sp. TAE3-ERU12]|uniref:pyridoxal 5'-phosphate synthase glutaminase subunit PdxT n=1 Tax=Corynebacterium sp. TAE3-ERU12 TaxID=2849491 RepID=UPI001C4814CD|nr:pyridoxal 5'-phosphate synthase glutaminase subunit PdxT [Corynebacterium sp. TAE3-ERU12]MBV7295352.1 pyridoxal 5'-phosphate synthase glutaminase subunit PdxT [Corynebacterium sp. TAE3-ERU12]